MARYEVRPLSSEDYATVMQLEDEVFGAAGEAVLGPYYVKLCCEFFGQTCLLALVNGEPAGYVLSFVRGREAYCTTLAVAPRFQGSRVAIRLVGGLVAALEPLVDSCWFTVKRDNASARALHAALGAKDVEVRQDFYWPGDERIISRVDRAGLEAARTRLEKLGLLPRESLAGAA
jgi:ribosomal protein S18 acetylase RimI-like enzyme